MTKSSLVKKGIISPYNSQSVHPSTREVSTGHWSRNWSRGHEEVLLTGLLLVSCSACFLMIPRTTNPKVAETTVKWILPHWSKMYMTGLSTNQSGGNICSTEVLLHKWLQLCQADINSSGQWKSPHCTAAPLKLQRLRIWVYSTTLYTCIQHVCNYTMISTCSGNKRITFLKKEKKKNHRPNSSRAKTYLFIQIHRLSSTSIHLNASPEPLEEKKKFKLNLNLPHQRNYCTVKAD